MTTSSERVTEDGPTLRGSVPSPRNLLSTFVVGLFMGTADGVPGVSGGTIALIAGIYERLIAAITAVTPGRAVRFVRAVLPVGDGVSARRAIGVLEEIDVWFLLALVSGVATAIVAVGQVVEWASEHEPVVLFGVFFGLIAASALILWRAISVREPDEIAAAIAGLVIAFVVSGWGAVLDGGGLALVFVAGTFAVSAMILPGISGSLILVILGQYTRMYETLGAFLDGVSGLASGGSLADVTGPGREVAVFVGGGLVGLFTVARVIRRALDANRSATLAFLVALVIGALRAPVAELSGPDYAVTWATGTVVEFGAAAAVGAAVVLALDWYAVDLDLESV